MNTVKADLSGLKTLQRQVGELSQSKAQVGIFADQDGRSADVGRLASNASIGAVHEFGLSYSVLRGQRTITIPERSWLRMPLTQHLGKLIESKGADWLWVLRNRGVKRLLAFLGALGEDVVQEAFATGGWGQWPAILKSTADRKHSTRILIETAQMRKAVSSRVV